MKKAKILFIGLFVSVLFVTGCGSEKTLTCSQTQSVSGVDIEQKVVMNFKKDKLSKLKMSVNSKATSDLVKKNWDVFASTLEKQYNKKSLDGIKLTKENDKKNYSYNISIDIDLAKASKSSLSEYNLSGIANDNSSMAEIKKDAEKDGYTCK